MAEKRTARILVVDDDPTLLELLTDTLLAIGYEATPATDGIIALDMLANQKFDLVITDIKMPRMDGLQLLKKIKRHYIGMPVLFITGVASQEVIGTAEVDGFLAKPFRIAHIEELIERSLSKEKKPNHRKPELLIIDLAGRIDETVTDNLAAGGYLLFHHRDLESALRELQHNTFKAIIADLTSWSANPQDTLTRIRQYAPDTPLIVNADAFSHDIHNDILSQYPLISPAPAPFSSTDLIGILTREIPAVSDRS